MRVNLLVLGLGGGLWLGCGDPHEPSSVNLRVLVSTVGVDQDSIYAVRTVDGSAHRIRGTLLLLLAPGEQDVVLDEVAPNCALRGQDTVRVTITRDRVVEAAFAVECRAVTGALGVTVPTTGRDFDADGYTVDVDEAFVMRVHNGSQIVIENLPAGVHVVRLGDFSSNCRVHGSTSQTAVVTTGELTRDTAHVLFEGSCDAVTGDVQVLTATRGVERDPNGYTLAVDGELLPGTCGWYDYYCDPGAPLLLVPTGSYLSEQLSPGDHLYRLGDIAPNCTVADGDSRTAVVAAGAVSTVRFDITCEGS
jgi:hypothetical protein